MSQSWRARFVFRCAFDSAKFKLNCFCLLNFFFQFVMNLLVKIYMKRHNRHNKTLCSTDFFNSVLSCILFIHKSSSLFHTEKRGDRPKDTSAAQEKKKKTGLPICHKL